MKPIIVVVTFTDTGAIEPIGFHYPRNGDAYAVSEVVGCSYQAPEIVFDVIGEWFRARLVFNRLTLLWVLTELVEETPAEISLAGARQGAL